MSYASWSGYISGLPGASYGAVGAGLAAGRGTRSIVLTNQKGAVLELSGREVGLMADLDLSGLALSIK